MRLPVRLQRLLLQLTIDRKRKRISFWHSLLGLCLLCLISAATLLWYVRVDRTKSSLDSFQFHQLPEDIFHYILNGLPKPDTTERQRCEPPDLPLFSKFIRDNRPELWPSETCKKAARGATNWLRVSASRVHFKPEFVSSSCTAEPIVALNDLSSSFGSPQPLRDGDELPSLGFRASCWLPDGRSHSSVYYGVKRAPDHIQLGEAMSSESLGNVIILGLDSLSRLESLRSLPRVSQLMRTRLGAVTLKQYNILGDGTPAALLPILTGVRESDMPESRRGFESARFLDESMRWIFQDLRDRGFVTLYGEEQNAFGTFQLRFLGFKRPPADFYLRPALLQQEKLQTKSICIGDEIAGSRMLTAVKDLFTLHPTRPKFSFVFFSSLSHENIDLTPMDALLSDFVDWFEKANLTRNTTLILMSDHGQRHGPLRNSMQGKLEESLPLMSIALSGQIVGDNRDAAQRLRANSARLTTPLDLHRTLLSAAGIAAGVTPATATDSRIRSYSLIDEAVPQSRSCSQAGIPTHWCSCLHLKKVREPGSDELTLRAARFAVDEMNSATQPFRHLCQELRLGNVTDADISLVSNDLSRRVRRISWNYMAYNSVNLARLAEGLLTLRLVTLPNRGHFDVTVQFVMERRADGHMLGLVSAGEASRTDAYGSQADCVVELAPHLRKFCLCQPVPVSKKAALSGS